MAGVYSLFPLLFTPAGPYFAIARFYRCTILIIPQNLWSRSYTQFFGLYSFYAPSIARSTSKLVLPDSAIHTADTQIRFPRTLPYVVIDILERSYLAGFPLLQVFVTVFPLITKRRSTGVTSDAAGVSGHTNDEGRGAFEFLPLMLTSVYCAIGLVWSFVRLSVIYLTSSD